MTRRSIKRRWLLLASVAAAAVSAAGLKARSPDAEAAYETTLAALEAGQIQAAEAGVARLSRLRAPTVLDRGLRARVAIARGRSDDAIAALRQIPEDHALSGWAHLRAGQVESRRRRFRAAEAELRQALRRQADLVEARRELVYVLGLQLRRLALNEEFERLAAAGALSPHEVWVWCMSRDLVWWTPEEQTAILEDALNADPADRWSRLALASTRARQGRYAEAESLLRPLPDSDFDALAARAGLVLERAGPEGAESMLATGPEGHPALSALRGRIALCLGDAAHALRLLEQAQAADPGRRQTLGDLGRAHQALGSGAKAEEYLAAAARVDALHNLLLKAEPRMGHADTALWLRLGSACEGAGRVSQALAWYRLVVGRDPCDTRAQQAVFRLTR
jgi:tetratricopeptide (TPR) repeat protein